jgi:putative Holliday junction resolvase
LIISNNEAAVRRPAAERATMGRIACIDLGLKRVGVAVSDPLQLIAQPLATLPYVSLEKLFHDVREIIRTKDVELVLVGIPVREDGREGEGAVMARRFKARLERSGIACLLRDESFSSREAEDVIHEHGKRRKAYREKIDQIAAAVVLREYLKESRS